MTFLIRILLMVALLVPQSFLYAAGQDLFVKQNNLVYLGSLKMPDGAKSNMYLFADSVSSLKPGYLLVELYQDYNRPTTVKGRTSASGKQVYICDCYNSELAVIELYQYEKRFLRGTLVYWVPWGDTRKPEDNLFYPPNTKFQNNLIKRICK